MSGASSLPGAAQAAPNGASGFDTESALTRSNAAAFVSAGFRFVVRYLSLETPSPDDLTFNEARQILKAGLALTAIQHAPPAGWRPSERAGAQYGRNAAQNAHSAGLPGEINLWLSLDGIDPGAAASEIAAYCNAWFEAVSSASYVPGLRVGAQPVLNDELINNLRFQYYWKSGGGDSAQPGVCFEYAYPANGYCIIQSIDNLNQLDHIAYNSDAVQPDNLANTPLWAAKQKRAGAIGRRDPAGSSKPAQPGAKFRIGSLIAPALAAIAAFAAGVITSPHILPKIQSALSALSAR